MIEEISVKENLARLNREWQLYKREYSRYGQMTDANLTRYLIIGAYITWFLMHEHGLAYDPEQGEPGIGLWYIG